MTTCLGQGRLQLRRWTHRQIEWWATWWTSDTIGCRQRVYQIQLGNKRRQPRQLLLTDRRSACSNCTAVGACSQNNKRTAGACLHTVYNCNCIRSSRACHLVHWHTHRPLRLFGHVTYHSLDCQHGPHEEVCLCNDSSSVLHSVQLARR